MKNYVLVDVSAAIHSLGLNDSCVDNYLFFNPFNHTKWLVYGIIYVPEQTPHEQLDYHFNTFPDRNAPSTDLLLLHQRNGSKLRRHVVLSRDAVVSSTFSPRTLVITKLWTWYGLWTKKRTWPIF